MASDSVVRPMVLSSKQPFDVESAWRSSGVAPLLSTLQTLSKLCE